MPGKKSTGPLALHGILALGATAMVAGVALLRLLPELAADARIRPALADVGVEHAGTLALWIRATGGRSPGLLELSHDGAEIVAVSVPADWTLREVRGVRLVDVPPEPPIAGSRRWRVPPGAILSFQTPSEVRLRLHNPSAVPLLVHHARVSLSGDTSEADSVLVAKDAAEIW